LNVNRLVMIPPFNYDLGLILTLFT
jgi:hypothetical protein